MTKLRRSHVEGHAQSLQEKSSDKKKLKKAKDSYESLIELNNKRYGDESDIILVEDDARSAYELVEVIKTYGLRCLVVFSRFEAISLS